MQVCGPRALRMLPALVRFFVRIFPPAFYQVWEILHPVRVDGRNVASPAIITLSGFRTSEFALTRHR